MPLIFLICHYLLVHLINYDLLSGPFKSLFSVVLPNSQYVVLQQRRPHVNYN
jgi:hypothetical protein